MISAEHVIVFNAQNILDIDIGTLVVASIGGDLVAVHERAAAIEVIAGVRVAEGERGRIPSTCRRSGTGTGTPSVGPISVVTPSWRRRIIRRTIVTKNNLPFISQIFSRVTFTENQSNSRQKYQ